MSTTKTIIRLPVNGKTVSAAVCLLGSAAVLCNMGTNESSSGGAMDALTGGRVGVSDRDRADAIMDRMLSIAEEDGRTLMKSAHVLNDGYYFALGTAGVCVDSTGEAYDHASNDKNSPQQCAQLCARSLLYSEHRGFNYNPTTKDCQCFFDDHKIPRPIQKKSKAVVIAPHGTGEVRDTDSSEGNAGYTCYKKDKVMVGSPLDSYESKRCDVDDGEVMDYVAFTAFEPEPCAELCGRFSLLETHRGFTVTQEGHCRCLFKEGEVPTERKLSNGGSDRFVGGYTFSERFAQFITPAETLCYDRKADVIASEPVANRLVPPTNNRVFINEFHFRNYQTNEPFVRVVGPKGADASNYAVISYVGRDGTIHTQTQLSGNFESPDDHPSFGFVKLDLPSTGLRKGKMGADGLAIVNTQTNQCLQFVSYASEPQYQRSFKANAGICQGESSVPLPVGVTEARDIEVGKSLQLVGSGNSYDAFAWTGPADAAAGTENVGQTLTAL